MKQNYLSDPFFQFGVTSVIVVHGSTNWFSRLPFLHNGHKLPIRVLFSGFFWYYLNQHRLNRQREKIEQHRALMVANQVSRALESEGKILESNEDTIKSYIKGVNY